MQAVHNRKFKITMITLGAILIACVLALSGIGLYFKLNHKPKGPTLQVNPLDFSVDAWDGKTVDGLNFNGNYAGRGIQTKTINSAASFVHFINEVNNGNTFENQKVYLNKSIDLKGYTIDSIASFKGTFDGGHFTILNANINSTALFTQTENAAIKNVGLYNSNVNLVDKAINTNISNCFVRLGNGLLVNEYVSNNGPHYIKNSFIDTQAKGFIYKIDTNSSNENTVSISNCYFTNGEIAIKESVGNTFVETENLIKITNKSDLADWSYSKEYNTENEWCDYDHLENTQKLDFNYPVQSGFVKVYLTGSCYESVMVTGDTVVDTTNLSEAFAEADKAVEAQINLLVEKIFMEAEAEVSNAQVKVNALQDTTIVRGENNTESMFVGKGNSKITIGSELQAGISSETSVQPTIVLDGNREYVEANDMESNALVVSYGGNVEIHDNVLIKNNVNNNIKYGGAVLVYESSAKATIDAKIENCHAEYAGGGVCVVGTMPESIGSVINCSAKKGGAVALIKELKDDSAVSSLRSTYGALDRVVAVDDHQMVSDGYSITGNSTYLGNTSTRGGAFYCSGGSISIEGSPTFQTCKAVYGGAIFVDNKLGINGSPTFNNCTADYGGAIWAGGNTVDDFGNIVVVGGVELNVGAGATKFDSCTSTYEGGAIYGHLARFEGGSIRFESCTSYDGGALYVVNDLSICGTAQIVFDHCNVRHAGGAVYVSKDIHVFGSSNTTFNTCYVTSEMYDGGLGGGAIFTNGNMKVSGVSNMSFNTCFTYSAGGAIYIFNTLTFDSAGLVEFKSCTATPNWGGDGGAIHCDTDVYFYNGTTKVLDCHAYNGSTGGGLKARNVIMGRTSTVEFNSCSASGSGGGAISAVTVKIQDLCKATFLNNSSAGGSGGGAISASVELTSSEPALFQNNRSNSLRGGAISNVTAFRGDHVFINNYSQTGGGAFATRVDLNIYGASKFINNTAHEFGGAIFADKNLNIRGSAYFEGNSADGEYGGWDTIQGKQGNGEAIYCCGVLGIYEMITLKDNASTNDSPDYEIMYGERLDLIEEIRILSTKSDAAIFVPYDVDDACHKAIVLGLDKVDYVYTIWVEDLNFASVRGEYIVKWTSNTQFTSQTSSVPFRLMNHGNNYYFSFSGYACYISSGEAPSASNLVLAQSQITARIDEEMIPFVVDGVPLCLKWDAVYGSGSIANVHTITSSHPNIASIPDGQTFTVTAASSPQSLVVQLNEPGLTIITLSWTVGRNGSTYDNGSIDFVVEVLEAESAEIEVRAEYLQVTVDDVVNFNVSVGGSLYDETYRYKLITSNSAAVQVVSNDTYAGTVAPGENVAINNALRAVGKGNATITFELYSNDNNPVCLGSGSFAVSVVALSVAVPTANTETFTYNGSEQTYLPANWDDISSFATISNNKQTNAGDYTVTIALKDKNAYAWEDGTTDDKTFTFTINKKKLDAPTNLKWQGVSAKFNKSNIEDYYSSKLYKDGVLIYSKECWTVINIPDDGVRTDGLRDKIVEAGVYIYEVQTISNNNKNNYESSDFVTSEPLVVRNLIISKDDGISSVEAETILIPGVQKTITATLAEHYTFASWSCNTTDVTITSTTTNPTKITLTNNPNDPSDIIIAATSTYIGKNITVSANNSAYGEVDGTYPMMVDAGTVITVSDNTLTIGGTTITATAKTSTDFNYIYKFKEWLGVTSPVSSDMQIVAVFEKVASKYNITISVNDPEIGQVDKESVTAAHGSEVTFKDNILTIGGQTVTATAKIVEGYNVTFTGWKNMVDVVEASTTIVACFEKELKQFSVTFVVNNEEWGQVSRTIPLNVNYDTPITVSGNIITFDGSTITATAKTMEHYNCSFVEWLGATQTVTNDLIITAVFKQEPKPYKVTILVDGADHGSVSDEEIDVHYGDPIYVIDNILTVGSQFVYALELEDTAQYDYAFTGWTVPGNISTIGGDIEITATFTRDVQTYTVNIVTNDSSMGDLGDATTTFTVEYGTKVEVSGNVITFINSADGSTINTVIATANSGYEFVKWQGVVGTVNNNIAITAYFIKVHYLTLTEGDDFSITVEVGDLIVVETIWTSDISGECYDWGWYEMETTSYEIAPCNSSAPLKTSFNAIKTGTASYCCMWIAADWSITYNINLTITVV